MYNRHLIVVSVDALVYEDLEYAGTLPFLGRILKEGSRINQVHSIYPTLTHPVHCSIMTGVPAGKTDVIANEHFVPGKLDRSWYNALSEVKAETIFHAAHKAGLSTAVCMWPCTARGGECIDYLIPEVMGLDMQGNEDDPLNVYRSLGTSENVMDIVAEAMEKFGPSTSHPVYDETEMWMASEILRKYRPNLLFCHPGIVDGERHRTGLFTEAVKASIATTDTWLQRLYEVAEEIGILEETDFVVLSDHGHLDIRRRICPNVFLRRNGLLRVNEKEELQDWDAYFTSCALSGYVYLRDPDNHALESKVYSLLSSMAEEKLYGFEKVFTKKEVQTQYGLDGDFSFVIETDGFTTFADDWRLPAVRCLDTSDYRFGHSTHGHQPEKGPQPVFLCMGPSFKKHVVLEKGDILNHAPTFAKLLGVELKNAQGRAVTELLVP